MKNEEYFELSNELEKHHSIFSKMWEIGSPVEDNKIDTLCVEFDSSGRFVCFKYNPEFFKELNLESKTFAIAHECLHVILNHGSRLIGKEIDSEIANISMDISINEKLIRMGWKRKNLNFPGAIAFVDTIFNEDVSRFESSEFYYKKLIKKQKETNEKIKNIFKIDINFSNNKNVEKSQDSSIEDIFVNINDEEINDIFNIIKSDMGEGDLKRAGIEENNLKFSFKKRIKKLKKWETLVKKWTKEILKEENDLQWAFRNKRYNLLPDKFFLPSNYKKDILKKEKIDIYLFLDTSGSCHNYAQRFFDLANSIPKDRFNIHLYCFSTNVYKVVGNVLNGFGGTYFHILEAEIQKIKRGGIGKYPRGVWVITDGWGNQIYPEKPERWTWLLTENNTKTYIPEASKVYELSEFE